MKANLKLVYCYQKWSLRQIMKWPYPIAHPAPFKYLIIYFPSRHYLHINSQYQRTSEEEKKNGPNYALPKGYFYANFLENMVAQAHQSFHYISLQKVPLGIWMTSFSVFIYQTRAQVKTLTCNRRTIIIAMLTTSLSNVQNIIKDFHLFSKFWMLTLC